MQGSCPDLQLQNHDEENLNRTVETTEDNDALQTSLRRQTMEVIRNPSNLF